MKVGLVHDFLIEYGGAERVLEALHEIWPKAPVYCAFYDPNALGGQAKRFKNWKIIASWGTRLPFWQKLVSPYRIFSKSFFESFDLSSFDLVVSSNAMYMAKAVKVPNGVHICYCHTPPRFLYGYPTAINWKKSPILRPIGEVINHVMRVWDYETAQLPSRKSTTEGQGKLAVRSLGEGRVDYFIANSREVAARIKKFYRRDSKVIYPPVDVKKFTTNRHPGVATTTIGSRDSIASLQNDIGYFLVVSRLVASKNVDVVVEVCVKLGLPLKVVGAGREMENLKQIAKRLTATRYSGLSRIDSGVVPQSGTPQNDSSTSSIEFLGDVNDDELITLYQNCRAVIFAASQEDFGLVPVEAMAAGKPVIANAEGGVLESVIDWSKGGKGKCTGVYFDPATAGSLTLAINNFADLEKKNYFDARFIMRHARKFSNERFKREILKFVDQKLNE